MRRKMLAIFMLLFSYIAPLSADDAIAAVQTKILYLDNWANDIAYSKFGNYVAVASRDNQVRVFSSNLRQEFIYRGRGAYGNASVLGFTPEEGALIFLKYESDKDLGVLDLETMEMAGVLKGHQNRLQCMDISPDGKYLASAGSSGELIIWRRSEGGYDVFQEMAVAANITKLVFGPESMRLAVIRHDDTADLFGLQDGVFAEFQHVAPEQHYGNTGYLYGFAFAPDAGQIVTGLRDEITIFDLRNGKYVPGQVISGLEFGYVHSLEFTPDGQRFACGFGRGIVQFVDKSGDSFRLSETIDGPQDYVRALDFSPSGDAFATGSSNSNTVIFRRLIGVGMTPVMALSRIMGLPFSKSQRSILDAKSAALLLSELDLSLTAAKDEFETTEEYEARLAELSARAIATLQNHTEKRYGIVPVSTDGSDRMVSIPLQELLDYSADKERYQIKIMNLAGFVDIKRGDAGSLKQSWQSATIVAERVPAPDGYSRNYLNFRLEHPETGAIYDVSLSENPFRAVPVNRSLNIDREWQVGPHLILSELTIDDIFPVFYKYYDTHPIGSVRVRNSGTLPVESIEVNFFVERYMDYPKPAVVPPEIAVGDQEEVGLTALFNRTVLEIAETDTLSASISISYSAGGEVYHEEIIQTIRLFDRNAISWDDDRKAAAFVTSKDPEVLRFAKRVIGSTEETEGYGLNRNLLQAMRLYEGMRVSGLTYVIDPTTPYIELSKTKNAIDFLQFPRQTLEFGAGDCDDLSILFNSLLESVGIPTAFITVPGHIFVAFSAGQHPSVARRSFSKPEALVFVGDETWIPFETTALSEGFLRAWEIGAGLFARYSALHEAEFFTTAEAWRTYEPVGFSEPVKIELPDMNLVSSSYFREFTQHRDAELQPREQRLLGELADNSEDASLINRLGVLYSRYGLYERALQQFEIVLSREEYLPAIMNKGNVHSILGELARAIEYFSLAARMYPDNPRILLSLTAVYLETGDNAGARETFERVKALDAGLAGRFPLLDAAAADGAARAGEQGGPDGIFTWEWE